MPRLTRRELLRIAADTAAVLGASRIFAGALGAAVVTPATGSTAPSPVSAPAAAAAAEAAGRARVAVVRGDDLYAMAREALAAVGGAGKIVLPGQTVFIKPNFVTAGSAAAKPITRNGECAKPEIVIAVAEECLKAGAAEVIIGDGAQVPRFSWDDIQTMDGATNVAREAARLTASYPGTVRLACLNADSPEWVEIPTGTSLGKIAISSLVARADRVISIPVIKTHTGAALSLSVKNFMGIASNERHGGYPYRKDLHFAGLEQSFLDIVAAVKPHLAIIDGSVCCEGNAPVVAPEAGRGRTVDMKERLGSWLLLASTDLVAADATAARIISHDPAGITQLRMAYERGMGEIREDHIDLEGGELDRLRVDWLPAELRAPRQQGAAG